MIEALGEIGDRRRSRSDRPRRFAFTAATAIRRSRRPICTSPTAARRCGFSRPWSALGTARIGSTARRGCGSGRSRICSTPCGNWGRRRQRTGNGCPPVVVQAAGLTGGRATVSRRNFQPVPERAVAGRPLCATAGGTGPSTADSSRSPYIEMTLAVMARFGVEVRDFTTGGFAVPAGMRYRGRTYEIEPDASAASYFFAAAAITGGQVTVEGLSQNSIQGDVAFCDCLAEDGLRGRVSRTCELPSSAESCTASTSI